MAGDNREKILQAIRMKGPVIPSQIKDVVNADILMTSAMLSELTSRNMLKVSSLKIGSSPLYYIPGQESRLQDFSNKLNEKDKRTYDLLKGKRILRENDLDPLTRVSLRQIKDFAKPLDVSFGDEKEIFWKWYLAPDDEVNALIKTAIETKEAKRELKKSELKEEKIEKEKPTVQEKVKQEAFAKGLPKTRKPRLAEIPEGDFVKEVHDYFKKTSIEVVEQNILKKDSEIDYIITLPTPVGNVTYYCKAKSKKKPSDSDLASAFVQGQLKKLPVLFLTPGELTKRAKDMLDKEFKNLIVKKI